MKLSGTCPSCGEGLPFRVKDKVKCPSCGKTLQSDPKMATIFSFLILIIVFVTYPIDWRLSIFLAVIISLVGLSKVKYQVVDEDKK